MYSYFLNNLGPQFSLICQYTLYGQYTSGNCWGAKQFTGEPTFDSYKYESMLNYVNGN